MDGETACGKNPTGGRGPHARGGLGDALAPFGPGVRVMRSDGQGYWKNLDSNLFGDFAVGDENRAAYEAVRAIAAANSKGTWPLFISGPCGSGKTHLFEALTWELGHSRPKACVRALRGSELLGDYISSARSGSGTAAPSAPESRGVRYFLVDEAEFFQDKRSASGWLCDLVEPLLRGRARVVFFSRVVPDDLRVDERFANLIASGTAVELGEAGPELRAEMLKALLRRYEWYTLNEFPDEFVDWLGALSKPDGHLMRKNVERLWEMSRRFAETGVVPDLAPEPDGGVEDEWEWVVEEERAWTGNRIRQHDDQGIKWLLGTSDEGRADLIDPTCTAMCRGSRLYCGACGAWLEPGAFFCPACGSRVEDAGALPAGIGQNVRFDSANAFRRHEPGVWERLLGMPDEELADLVDPRCGASLCSNGRTAAYRCDACGWRLGGTVAFSYLDRKTEPARYCPGCGRRIEQFRTCPNV